MSQGPAPVVGADPPVNADAMLGGDRPEMGGLHAGAIVFVGLAGGTLGNYLFHLVSGRILGPADYGDLASLLVLAGLVALPFTGAQFAVAQYTARFRAEDDARGIGDVYRQTLTGSLLVGTAIAAVLGAVSIYVQRALNVDSLAAILLTAALTIPAVAAPVVWGVVQGLERFVLYAFVQAAGPALRILLLVPLLAVGLEVDGAMAATLVGTLAFVLIPLWLTRKSIATRRRGRAVEWREAGGFLLPVMLGILAITSLTTVDVVVAKLALPDRDAGVYGAASLVGRVILYLPAAIATVLLPKVSARATLRRETSDVLKKSLFAAAGLCAAGTVVYAAAPELVMSIAFGEEYVGARDYLWLFAVAMTGFALLNVLLTYEIAHRRFGLSWLLAVGAVAQIAAFAVFHASPQQLLAVSIAVAASLLTAYVLVRFARDRAA